MSYIYKNYLDVITNDPSLTHIERNLYKYLVSIKWSYQKKGESGYVSHAYTFLALKLGVSESSAKRSVKKLIKIGYLIRLKRGGGDGRSFNFYSVIEFPSKFYEEAKIAVKEKVSDELKLKMAVSELAKRGMSKTSIYASLDVIKLKKQLEELNVNSLKYYKLMSQIKSTEDAIHSASIGAARKATIP